MHKQRGITVKGRQPLIIRGHVCIQDAQKSSILHILDTDMHFDHVMGGCLPLRAIPLLIMFTGQSAHT